MWHCQCALFFEVLSKPKVFVWETLLDWIAFGPFFVTLRIMNTPLAFTTTPLCSSKNVPQGMWRKNTAIRTQRIRQTDSDIYEQTFRAALWWKCVQFWTGTICSWNVTLSRHEDTTNSLSLFFLAASLYQYSDSTALASFNRLLFFINLWTKRSQSALVDRTSERHWTVSLQPREAWRCR